MQEDFDLLPIDEKFARLGMKGTGGARRPHIKREKSPYNNKVVYHVVDSKGVVKHSTSDEGEAKQHLAQKYNSYLGEAKKLKGKDPCWDNYKMVGLKANGDPNCVGPVKEATSVAVRMQRALDKIKADRERRERLAAPYVNSVFGKKDENKPEPKKD